MSKIKIMALLSAIALFAGCGQKPAQTDANNNTTTNETSQMAQIDGNMENFNDIINGDQLTLVDFYATWCGPCQKMHPVLDQLKADLGEQIRIVKLDVDKNEALSAQYNVQSIPTLMLVRKGETLWRQSGAMNIVDLKSVVKQYQ